MDITKIKSLAILEEKMKYNSSRQQVIAENFANVDTPGYKRKELEEADFGNIFNKQLKIVEPARTNANHLPGLDDGTLNGWKILTEKNKVQADMEALEMMKNSTSFAEASSTYKKLLSLIKEAVGNNGSN